MATYEQFHDGDVLEFQKGNSNLTPEWVIQAARDSKELANQAINLASAGAVSANPEAITPPTDLEKVKATGKLVELNRRLALEADVADGASGLSEAA